MKSGDHTQLCGEYFFAGSVEVCGGRGATRQASLVPVSMIHHAWTSWTSGAPAHMAGLRPAYFRFSNRIGTQVVVVMVDVVFAAAMKHQRKMMTEDQQLHHMGHPSDLKFTPAKPWEYRI